MRNKRKFISMIALGALALSLSFNLARATDGSSDSDEMSGTPSTTTTKVACPLDLTNDANANLTRLSKDCVRLWCLKNTQSTNSQNLRLCAELQKIQTSTTGGKEVRGEDSDEHETEISGKIACRLEPPKPTDSTTNSPSTTGTSTSTTTTTNTTTQFFTRICDGPNGEIKTLLKKLEDKRAKEREDRIKEIGKIYQNQIDRAQKAIDNLSKIIDRIKAKRALVTNTDDLASLDALIAKAETQKATCQTALADVKAKADAIKATLTDAKTNTDSMADVPTATVTGLKQQVKEFQTLVLTLKKDLIALHSTLQQTVKIMKRFNGNSQGQGNTNTNPNATSDGEKENE
jgi:hypothetical protein